MIGSFEGRSLPSFRITSSTPHPQVATKLLMVARVGWEKQLVVTSNSLSYVSSRAARQTNNLDQYGKKGHNQRRKIRETSNEYVVELLLALLEGVSMSTSMVRSLNPRRSLGGAGCWICNGGKPSRPAMPHREGPPSALSARRCEGACILAWSYSAS